jgi:hypothetical protein
VWKAITVGRYGRESERRTDILFSDGSQWMFAMPMNVDQRWGQDLVIGGKSDAATIGWLESPAHPKAVNQASA